MPSFICEAVLASGCNLAFDFVSCVFAACWGAFWGVAFCLSGFGCSGFCVIGFEAGCDGCNFGSVFGVSTVTGTSVKGCSVEGCSFGETFGTVVGCVAVSADFSIFSRKSTTAL